MEILGLVLIVFVLFILIGIIFLGWNIDNSVVKVRYDDDHTLHYFSVEDFESLVKEDFTFLNNKGLKLQGYEYKNPNFKEYKAILVFVHGLGAGHIQYTTEINHFAQLGYLVISYDMTGCLNSEGKNIKGFEQAILDLDACLNYVKNNSKYSSYEVVACGHSMGAYALNNVLPTHEEVKVAVSISSFNNANDLIEDQLRLFLKKNAMFFIPWFRLKKKLKFSKLNKVTSLKSLKNSKARVLFVQGDLDAVVPCDKYFNRYKKELENDDRFTFLLSEGKYHRPLLTKEAAEYETHMNMEFEKQKADYKGKISQERINEYFQSLDYNLLVELDQEVMEKIDEFLDSSLNNN